MAKELPGESREKLEALLEEKAVEKPFYTVQEFSDRTGIPGSKIRAWLRKGILKGMKPDRAWFIPHAELERTLNMEL